MTIAVSHFCATLLPSRLVAGKSEMRGRADSRSGKSRVRKIVARYRILHHSSPAE